MFLETPYVPVEQTDENAATTDTHRYLTLLQNEHTSVQNDIQCFPQTFRKQSNSYSSPRAHECFAAEYLSKIL